MAALTIEIWGSKDRSIWERTEKNYKRLGVSPPPPPPGKRPVRVQG